MERLKDGFVLKERYRLRRRIASGGMGAVWEADDELLHRPVAIKIMHPHTASEQVFARRFRDEAQYAAKLRSSNIVNVYDYGEDHELAFLVMELVTGKTVAQLIATRGPLEPEFVRSVLIQVASALAEAHEWGIIHRDVKPSNILVTASGEAKLSDFGIARAAQGEPLTQHGEVLGTPQYLSPEQATGQPASPASDLYALGVVAHEMLTSVKPFDGTTPVAIALAHVNEPPPPLPPSVPSDLAEVVSRCLSKDPRLRPASADAVIQDLQPNTGGLRTVPVPPLPDRRPPAPPLTPASPTTGRHPLAPDLVNPRRTQQVLAVAATLLVVVLCLAALFL